jgi:hypothetical protein
MSLGGVYMRAVARLLYDADDGKIANMQPEIFLAIASPFLGVKDFTYVPLISPVQQLIAFFISDTGRDLFRTDDTNYPLLFNMCTSEEYLGPLRKFKKRCLYAALENDFMVPLGTAAFLPEDKVRELRSKHTGKKGLLETLVTIPQERIDAEFTSSQSESAPSCVVESNNDVIAMRRGLESLGTFRL